MEPSIATMEPLWSHHGAPMEQNFALLYQGTLGRKMVSLDPRGPYWLVLGVFWRFEIFRNFLRKKIFLEYRSEQIGIPFFSKGKKST
jgi:hypothetical protein